MEYEKTITIRDIAQLLGVKELKARNGETFCVCPFCGDTRGKFSYIVNRNGRQNCFHCFHCGEHGGMMSLYEKVTGQKFTRKALGENFIPAVQEKETEIPERVSDDTCNMVYKKLLSLLQLSEKHRDNLLKRGLSEAEILLFNFKSVPSFAEKGAIEKEMYFFCKKNGINPYGIPGLYSKNGKLKINLYSDGFLCPVYNKGKILGFQIRLDEPKDGQKYIWFSSSGKDRGISSGSPTTFLKGKRADIIITEGILKSEVVYCLLDGEFSVVGLPGVGVQHEMGSIFRENPDAVFFEAFDADKFVKFSDRDILINFKEKIQEGEKREELLKLPEYDSIKKALNINNAARMLAEAGRNYGCSVVQVRWNIQQERYWDGRQKGIDDYLEYHKGFANNSTQDFKERLVTEAEKIKEIKTFLK